MKILLILDIKITFILRYKFQGITMTVEQCSIKFTELARFGINLIPDEVSKTECFENGLNSRIKERVVYLEIKNYVQLMNVASLAEKAIRETSVAYEHKKRSMPQASYPSKLFVIGTSSKSANHKSFPPLVGNQKAACPKYGRYILEIAGAKVPAVFDVVKRVILRRIVQ